MNLPNWNDLADDALAGKCLSREQSLAVLRAPDEVLLEQLNAAYRGAPPLLGKPSQAALFVKCSKWPLS